MTCMPGASSQVSADSTSPLNGPGSMSPSPVSSTRGAGESSKRVGLKRFTMKTSRRSKAHPEQLTCCAVDSPAKTSPLRGKGRGLKAQGQVSSSSSPVSQKNSNSPKTTDGSSWRTFPDFSPLTAVGTSGSSFKRWPTSGLLSDTAFSTAAFSEFPSDAVECSLSDILEPTTHERFSLTAKAARGVLNRAAKRGRKLPSSLSVALETVALTTTTDSLVAHKTHQAKMGDPSTDTYVVAAPLTAGTPKTSHQAGRRQEDDINLIAGTLRSHARPGSNDTAPIVFHFTQDPISSGEFSPAMSKGNKNGVGSIAVAFSENQRAEVVETEYMHQLTTGGGKPGQGYPAARIGSQVRRLTPTECERLQGFPDGWTAVDGDPTYAQAKGGSWRCKEGTPDSRRYAAMGDAVTVNTVEWIAQRMAAA